MIEDPYGIVRDGNGKAIGQPLERSVPTPKPTANEQVHRLDAEAEAFMQQHASGIIRAWEKYGDPVSYEGWNEGAVRKHWPELWTRWRAWQQAHERLDVLVGNEKLRRNSRPG